MLLFLLATACEPLGPFSSLPDSDGAGQEAVVVSPGERDFGTISVIEDGYATSDFVIRNAGTDTVIVHGQDEVIGDSHVFEVAADPLLELQPGNSQEILVTFRPLTEDAYYGEIRFNYGIETIYLSGSATAPVLVADVPQVSSTAIGCSRELAIPIRNGGSETLEILGVESTDDAEYAVGLPDALTLEPGDSTEIAVTFSPLDGGQRSTTVSILSNDPAKPNSDPATIGLKGTGILGDLASEEFIYAPGLDADVLFVVDTDGVMGTIVDLAEPALAAFLDQMDAGNVDLHAAVLTGDSTCPTTVPTWVSSGDLAAARLQTLQEGLHGDSGSWSDTLVALASSALANETGSGDCLEDFLRAGAQLHVVVISGGPDASGLNTGDAVNALRSAAPSAANAIVSTLIVTDSSGCSGATYGDGYAQIARATGGVIGDLCEDDWSDSFVDFADVSVLAASGAMSHALESTPLEDTIEVKVDGTTWTRWTYDIDTNSVVFSGTTLPDTGASVQIDYMLAQSCE